MVLIITWKAVVAWGFLGLLLLIAALALGAAWYNDRKHPRIDGPAGSGVRAPAGPQLCRRTLAQRGAPEGGAPAMSSATLGKPPRLTYTHRTCFTDCVKRNVLGNRRCAARV